MKRIVVAFPMSRPYAASLLSALVRACSAPLPGGACIILKSHPRLDARSCATVASLPAWVNFDEAPLSALLSKADGFVYAPQTASWWEAYRLGIPVLKYIPDAVDIDTDEVLPQGATAACDLVTLRQALETLLATGRRSPSAGVWTQMFAPVDEAIWRALVA